MQIFNSGSESLSGLQVPGEANLFWQLKSTWQEKGNLLGTSAHLEAKWFKTRLWGYFGALLEISIKPDSL